jgi:catechol 2,3-dioxygenase-like lactoylglutathione lyase family enzyme
MTHYSRLSKIVLDVPEEAHEAEVAFWQGALGVTMWTSEQFPEYRGADLTAGGFGLLVQRLGHGGVRVHIDIHASDRTAETARLEALGASVVNANERWTVMRDPAGLVFCVVPDPHLDDSNAHRW